MTRARVRKRKGDGEATSWSIGELARRAGLQPSAIRYYESEGLLPEPRRWNGRRIYDASALEWLSVVRLAQAAGFSIAEIHTLMHGFARGTPASRRWRALAERKLDEIRQRIAVAQAMERVLGTLLDCECPTLQVCAGAMAEGGCAPDPE